MMDVSIETSNKLKNMALLCSVLVVGIHVRWPHDEIFSLGWFGYHFVKEGVARVAVPFFFVVSGFFLARHFDDPGWWHREVGKRIRSLVIPFYVWSLIAVFVTIPFSIVADMIARRPFGTSVASSFPGIMPILALDLTQEPILIPLWYVRCLFLFVLTSFIIKFFVCRIRFAWMIASLCLMLAFALAPEGGGWHMIFDHGYSVKGLFYFSVGAWLVSCGVKYSHRTIYFAAMSAIIGLALMFMKVFAFEGCTWAINMADSLMIPFLLYAIWYFVPTWEIPDFLAQCPFPIYLMHGVVFIILGLVWRNLGLVEYPLAYAFTMYFTGVTMPMVVLAMLRKWMPSFAAVVLGGR